MPPQRVPNRLHPARKPQLPLPQPVAWSHRSYRRYPRQPVAFLRAIRPRCPLPATNQPRVRRRPHRYQRPARDSVRLTATQVQRRMEAAQVTLLDRLSASPQRLLRRRTSRLRGSRHLHRASHGTWKMTAHTSAQPKDPIRSVLSPARTRARLFRSNRAMVETKSTLGKVIREWHCNHPRIGNPLGTVPVARRSALSLRVGNHPLVALRPSQRLPNRYHPVGRRSYSPWYSRPMTRLRKQAVPSRLPKRRRAGSRRCPQQAKLRTQGYQPGRPVPPLLAPAELRASRLRPLRPQRRSTSRH